MKQLLFLAAIITPMIFSCTKDSSCEQVTASLSGKWKMIVVTDISSGSATTKPASIQGDVFITFNATSDAGGIFYGNTPTNEIAVNNYATGANYSLSIQALSMTKVGETSWGNEFVDNIRSAIGYNISGNNKLIINTPGKTLTFERL
jgi:hypothetical protein